MKNIHPKRAVLVARQRRMRSGKKGKRDEDSDYSGGRVEGEMPAEPPPPSEPEASQGEAPVPRFEEMKK